MIHCVPAAERREARQSLLPDNTVSRIPSNRVSGFWAFTKGGADLLPGSGSAAMSIPARPFYEQAAKLFVRRFRCKRGDDFFETRIAAQGIPLRIETEMAIRWPEWNFAHYVQLF